jgi:biotin carboxylase
MPKSFLCISSYHKGEAFLRACKEAGNKVYFITSKHLENKPWPWEAIDETFYMEADEKENWNMNHLTAGLAHAMRSRKFDRIVALDDFDVEKAAQLREEFRIPGMGQTTARHFRDKLAMRMKAKASGILVPPFSALFNDAEVNEFARTVPAPWVLKPRGEASATGIRKIHNIDELWHHIHSLGENRAHYLVEQFKPGAVYHVDCITDKGTNVFTWVSQYLKPPFDVAHGGGIFQTATVPLNSEDDIALKAANQQLMHAFGLRCGASHTEYIKSNDDGRFYFLETSSRVGGAHIADMVEMSSGVNLWAEWARVETAAADGTPYQLPPIRRQHAGLIVSLSRYEWPDDSCFNDPEVCWRMRGNPHHIGLIVKADSRERVEQLLVDYAGRIQRDFHAAGPSKENPTHT